MTTLKPQLVRADTLDLQDLDAPSAQDHTRQPTHPSPFGYGPAAPHQAQTLRHAQEEEYHQQRTSPRVSEDQVAPYHSHQHFYDDPEDELEDDHLNHLHDTNGVNDHDRDFEEGDGGDGHEDDLDDDLLDKISSSPSIEDGKYSLPTWPPRSDSVDLEAPPASFSTPIRGISPLSAPAISPPFYFPLPALPELDCGLYSHHGKHVVGVGNLSISPPKEQAISLSTQPLGQFAPTSCDRQEDFGVHDISRYLLPVDDPLLNTSFDQADEGFYDDDDQWLDETESVTDSNSSSEDDSASFAFTDDSRFIDSGWGGECLREIEDIDFEFVYALHTFVATVEGQANATKGDTMVLLDDTNSYWWLVRVVKDGSIGYLPAEHIETPTERLARLNKHRNIDLSASMLGDNPEKSKNPLKKAMRRRNAKTVQFAAPTFYEATDYDFSDEEDLDESQLEPVENGVQADDVDRSQNHQTADIIAPVQQSQPIATTNGIVHRIASEEELVSDKVSSPITNAPEPLQIQSPVQDVSRSRKGVVRNTDSFFKDDTVETRKISLTPRLLRGDSDSTASADQELRQRPSLETFDKIMAQDDKPKEDKKKEKKGMLSGLFKRKDKNAKGSKESDKPSEEPIRQSPQSKESAESLAKTDLGPERRPSKLQKFHPTYISPKSSPTEAKSPQRDGQQPNIQGTIPPAPTAPAPAPPNMHIQRDDQAAQYEQNSVQQEPSHLPVQTPNRFPSLQEKRSIFSPITTALKHSPSTANENAEPVVKPVYSKRAKNRFAIDESDSEEDRTPIGGPHMQAHRSISPPDDSHLGHSRTDSGMQISPLHTPSSIQAPFQQNEHSLAVDTAHDGAPGPATRSSPQPMETTPIESEQTASTSKPSPSTATHTPSTSRSTPTWSDASLRSYMENDQDIKDLLIIVHDKSNVTPVGPDHPLMTNLFTNERSKLTEMQSQLDTMLMSWMSKKNGTFLSR